MNSWCNRFYQANVNEIFLSVSEQNDQNDCAEFLMFLTSLIQTNHNVLYDKINWINSIIYVWYLQSEWSGLLWFIFHLDIWELHLSITLWICLESIQVHIQCISEAVIIECKYWPLFSICNWGLGYKKCCLHMLHRKLDFFTFPPFINFCLIHFTNSHTICYQYTVFYTYLQGNVQPYFSVHNICILRLSWYLKESERFSVIEKISFSLH
jgi:hypothetical protein